MWRGRTMERASPVDPASAAPVKAPRGGYSGETAMIINSAEDLFKNELCDIFSAEQQLSQALPQMTQSVRAEKLRQRLQERLQQGQSLLQRLDSVLNEMNVPRDQAKNEAMRGLIGDARELVDATKAEAVKDAALIGAVQKIEHYCIAAWGTAEALGRTVGNKSAVEAFQKAVDDGRRFDKTMTELAENDINRQAGQAKSTRH